MFEFTGDYAAAADGAYFTSWIAATASTAVATTTQALGIVNPALVINNDQPPGGKNLYLRRARFEITTATTGLTTVEHAGVHAAAGSHTTVGTLMSTPVNVNGSSGVGSVTKLWAGVNVATSPSGNARILHTGTVTNSIPIVLDTFELAYGEPTTSGTMIGTMTLVKKIVVPIPPVIIAPRSYYFLGFWGASWAASAPTYRIAVEWIEM